MQEGPLTSHQQIIHSLLYGRHLTEFYMPGISCMGKYRCFHHLDKTNTSTIFDPVKEARLA
jgi:hypothetical protein